MGYYHIVIEARENLGKNDETRDITVFDIENIRDTVDGILRPYLKKTDVIVDGEQIQYQSIDLFAIKYTQFPIQYLIEEEQKSLPSNTDICITAFEIFNDKELSQDITQVVFDLLDDN